MRLKKLFAKLLSEASETLPIPTITEEVVAEAKMQANGWVYAMEGISDPNGAVPPERIRGAWKVNAHGEIEGDFIPNPKYRPLERAT